MSRELTSRFNAGITVSLLWDDSAKVDPTIPEFQVEVFDAKNDNHFVLALDTFQDAREAYFHPFATASRYLKSGKITA